MAQKVQVLLTDDLDGSVATTTVRFGWQGTDYEIDLNDKHCAAFEKPVAKYLAAARRTKPAPAAPRTQRSRRS